MSRFYVGQRVRIKWSRGWPELAGSAGTIKKAAQPSERGLDGYVGDWHVIPNGHTTNLLPCSNSTTGMAYFVPLESQLEPATDSYDVTTWDTCVWKPEHLRVEA